MSKPRPISDPTANAAISRTVERIKAAIVWRCVDHDRDITEPQANTIHARCRVISITDRFEQLAKAGSKL